MFVDDKDPHWLSHVQCSPLNGRPGRKKVAIVGASQIDKAERPPLEDPDWDVWSCNSLWGLCSDKDKRFRADRWFELHPLSVQTEQEYQEMIDCPVPLYVLEQPKVTDQTWRKFPLDEIRQRFGSRDYFTCTMCYQVALALFQGYRTVGLWGLELWQGSARERTVELRGLEFWLGVAKGMGVEIVLPAYSCLIQHPYLYGYDYHEESDYTNAEVESLVQKGCEEWTRDMNAEDKRKLMRCADTMDFFGAGRRTT